MRKAWFMLILAGLMAAGFGMFASSDTRAAPPAPIAGMIQHEPLLIASADVEGLPGHRHVHRLPPSLSLPLLHLSEDLPAWPVQLGRCLRVGALREGPATRRAYPPLGGTTLVLAR